MIQTRICSYLDPGCKHASPQPVTFLALPEEVRFRIYRYAADLAPDTTLYFREKDGEPLFSTATKRPEFPLHLFGRGQGWPELEWTLRNFTSAYLYNTDDYPRTAFAPYYTLRLVNRKVNMEIPRFLCSTFEIGLLSTELSPASTSFLLEPPWSLLDLCKSLKVVINIPQASSKRCSCECCRELGRRSEPHWNNDLGDFLPLWTRIVAHLSLAAESSKNLKLRLMCDTDDAEIASSVLKPLEAMRAQKCTIRLCRKYIPALETLARRAVLGVIRCTARGRDAFRLLDLPPLLRQRVLSFTDLVTTSKDVQWGEQDTALEGADLNVYHIRDSPKWDPWERRYHRLICSNHNSVYPSCGDCFRSHIPLFLVCKTMLQNARQIFFSSNRLIVLSRDAKYKQPYTDRKQKFQAATLLTKVVPRDSLRHIRDLEIHFPWEGYSHLGIRPYVLKDWEQAIDHAAQGMSKLTLALYMSHPTYFGMEHTFPLPTEDVAEDLKSLFLVHEQIVRPLRRLQPVLRGFFVFAAAVFCHGRDRETWQRFAPMVDEHERQLERLVMGEDYDSVADNKMQRVKSRFFSQFHRLD